MFPVDAKRGPVSGITPDDFSILLHRCQRNRWNDRLTIFVLVGFCGVRVEEASKLIWKNISFENQTVLVPAHVAKKAGFRMNKIPPNAMGWLASVRDRRRTERIIGNNWKTLLRSTVRFAKINYRKNSIRHSFCSYAIGAGWPLADVIAYMGHGGSPSMIHSHYRNVVSSEESKKWFEIHPAIVPIGRQIPANPALELIEPVDVGK